MATRSALINVMVRAAEKAGRSLVRDFGEVEQLQVSKKGPADFVSNADLKSEKILKEELSKARPKFGLMMEESGITEGQDDHGRWIVDPLDGTTNFLHGIPHWSISIAAEQNGQLVAGVVYNPVAHEMFTAEKGQGAYLNDRRLRVSARKDIANAIVGTGAPFLGHGDIGQFTDELVSIMPNVAGVRRMGSAALDLAYFAAGRFDAYWERNLNPWDVSGGIVLAREAGGLVSGLVPSETPESGKSLLASTPGLHRLLLDMLASKHSNPGKRAGSGL